jgi:hypothetical protein
MSRTRLVCQDFAYRCGFPVTEHFDSILEIPTPPWLTQQSREVFTCHALDSIMIIFAKNINMLEKTVGPGYSRVTAN